MKIEFSNEEKIAYLEKVGYTVDVYTGVRDRDHYHNDKEVVTVNVVVAYTGDKPELDGMDMYHLRNKYGIDEVFHRSISKRFKQFVMNELAYDDMVK